MSTDSQAAAPVTDRPLGRTPDPEFVPAYDWAKSLADQALSTKRGFVFQYPPFPALERVAPEPRVDPAALYVHVPFCPYHCAYCYYAVEVRKDGEAIDRYLTAVENEIDLWRGSRGLSRFVFRTLFFGGGTPTYLGTDQLLRLIGALRSRIDLSNLEEFTVESDPTTLTAEKVDALVAAGVNRMSMGVQSFSTEINMLNERKHTREETLAAWELVRRAGVKNVNLDLICGLVGEDEQSWNETLDTLLSLAPEHVTIYLFSLRPQTSAFVRLKNGRIASPPEEAERVALYLQARRRLTAAGYVQTTPNCFVRERRFEQVHQRNAWSSLPLIGFGNSSYSFFDDWVTQNVRSVTDYKREVERGRIPVDLAFRIDAREAMVRYALLSLKQLRISRPAFRERFGFDLVEVIGAPVQEAVDRGLATLTESEFALTEQGIVYVDDVCRSFYSPAVRNRLESPTVQDQASKQVHLKLLQSLI